MLAAMSRGDPTTRVRTQGKGNRLGVKSRQFTLRGILITMFLWALALGIAAFTASDALGMCGVALFVFGGFLILVGSALWRLWMVVLGIILVWTAAIPTLHLVF